MAKARKPSAKQPGAKQPSETPKALPADPRDRVFEDTGLALCVVEALVDQGLISTAIKIPELAPQDDDDLDDESESWRDRLDTNQDESIDALLTLLEKHRNQLPKLRRISGVLLHIAEDYEPDVYTLRGIEACTGLEELAIWSRSPRLDLSPLAALPKLSVVDLGCAFDLRNFEPLYELRALRCVIGPIDPRVAAELRSRGIEVKDGRD